MSKHQHTSLVLAFLAALSCVLSAATQQLSYKGVVINEVSAGPGVSYVELYNSGLTSESLNGYTLVTSQGTYSLAGLPASMGPGQYSLLALGHPSEAGVSQDSDVLAIVIDTPLVGGVVDTVLLKKNAAIKDAVSYGTIKDTSSLYEQAVSAGQFLDGQYVNISGQFGEAAIGRNLASKDTNSLAVDWQCHGGQGAVIGSPLQRNNALVGGEEFSVKCAQEILNQVLINNYYKMSITDASYSGYSGSTESSTAVHRLVVDSPDIGLGVPLVGPISFASSSNGNGGFTLLISGALQGPSGESLALNVQQAVTSSGSSTIIDVLVTKDTSEEMPCHEEINVSWTGQRGLSTMSQSRVFVGWTGIERETTATTDITWVMQNGLVQSVEGSTNITRDWPISDKPFATANVWDVFTTEEWNFETTTVAGPGGLGISFQAQPFVVDYGPQYGSAAWNLFAINITSEPAIGTLAGAIEADVVYNNHATAVRIAASSVLDQGGRLVSTTLEYRDGSSLVGGNVSSIDPPSCQQSKERTWRDKLRSAAGWCARRAMTGVAGAACAVATSCTAATAGITTWASLGAATPAGLGATLAVGGACAVCTGGVYEVLAPLDDI